MLLYSCYLNILVPPLGKRSVRLICPNCKSLVMTRVKDELTSAAYICCLLMIVVGYVEKNMNNYIVKIVIYTMITYFMKLNNHGN